MQANGRVFSVFCFLLLVSSEIVQAINATCGSIQADVIFIIDASGSVREDNFPKELAFAADFSNIFNIGPTAIQVGVITFSDIVKEECSLSKYSDKVALLSAIRAINYTMGHTFTNLGLQYARELGFTPAGGDRPQAPNIIILLTDGKSNDPNLTKHEAELFRNGGAEIYAIGIGQGVTSTDLITVATNHAHVYMVENFQRLAEFVTTIAESVCQSVEPCIGFQCLHGGTCMKNNRSASCQCVAGYTGQHCDSDIDECATHNPCLHGATCTNTHGSYSCRCTAGYQNYNCQTDIDECATHNPCLHGATCTNTPGSYSCQCVPGFIGSNCQADIDECSTYHPCHYGATCHNTPGSYTCTCTTGFMGQHCDIDIDECLISDHCLNGATCTNAPGSYRCHCTPGYDGNNCQTDIDECITHNPCLHGATCTNTHGSYSCQCVPGFKGNNCQTVMDECASHPCQNGGTCTDLFNDYNCTCRNMVVGKNCEIDLCADIAPNCGELFNVCIDQVKRNTICRGTCDVCGDTQVFAGQTQSPAAANDCRDVLPDCGNRFGACRDRIMAEMMCQKTCGVCKGSEAQLLIG